MNADADKVIGGCGTICTGCPAYTATQANDSTLITQWASMFIPPINPDDAWCDGCFPEGGRKSLNAADCDKRACLIERELTLCKACEDYAGCSKYVEW